MPITQPVNKEAIRILVKDLGYQETEKRTGIAANTLYQWARRFAWNTPVPHAQDTVRTVRPLGETHAQAIAELESETRISLARSAARMTKEGETASLKDAPYVHKAAQVAGIAFKWRDDDKPSHFTLNQLNINTLSIDSVDTPEQ